MFKPVSVSASQIDAYRTCPRRWWFRSIRKLPSPTTPALVFGDRFSKAVEARLKGQPVPLFDPLADAVIARFLEAAESFYPAPNPSIYAERKVEFALTEQTRMVGYLDVLDLSGDEIRIRDHKTRADKRYALSTDKLRSDLQLGIYAHAIFLEHPEAAELSVGHINYVKPPKEYANDLKWIEHEWEPSVFLRHTPLDRAAVAVTMAGVLEDAAAMTTLADPLLETTSVPLDTTGRACFAYNQPCPYAGICPKVTLMLKTTPPAPSPQRSPAGPPAPGPRPAGPPAPPRVGPPTPNRPAGPPAPPRVGPPAPPRVDSPVLVQSQPLAAAPSPAYADDVFDPPVNPSQASAPSQSLVQPIPLAKIPGIKPATVQRLAALGYENSLEVAHTTIAYLQAAGMTRLNLTVEIDLLAEQMRTLHGVTAPRPFDFCPIIGEQAASPAEVASALPAHAGTPPLAATPPSLAVGPAAPAAPAAASAGFILYLDCSPVKGAAFVTLEDWLDPVFRGIEQQCGVQHWRSVLEFGKASELFHAAVRNALDGRSDLRVPAHLVVLSTYSDYAKSTLDLLIRYATVVVRR